MAVGDGCGSTASRRDENHLWRVSNRPLAAGISFTHGITAREQIAPEEFAAVRADHCLTSARFAACWIGWPRDAERKGDIGCRRRIAPIHHFTHSQTAAPECIRHDYSRNPIRLNRHRRWRTCDCPCRAEVALRHGVIAGNHAIENGCFAGRISIAMFILERRPRHTNLKFDLLRWRTTPIHLLSNRQRPRWLHSHLRIIRGRDHKPIIIDDCHRFYRCIVHKIGVNIINVTNVSPSFSGGKCCVVVQITFRPHQRIATAANG